MAKTTFFLDGRNTRGEAAQVFIAISHRNTRVLLATDVRVKVAQWDGKVINHPNAESLNQYLDLKKTGVDKIIYMMSIAGELETSTAADIKARYTGIEKKDESAHQKKNFVSIYQTYAKTRRSKGTRDIYSFALKKMMEYDPQLDKKSIDKIDKNWMKGFYNDLLTKVSVNSASIYMRSIHAIFNDALDDELTSNDPFRKIRIKNSATKDRSMTVEQLRQLFAYPCEEWQREYIDMFKLIFCLCGINLGDLAGLKEIRNGRIEYDRLKTGRHYDIKVEPEAMEIIDKYRGETHLLSILDKYSSHRDYNHHMNSALKKVGMDCALGKKATGTPLFPDISTYYARYSWASIAAELEIPYDTIAAALGHSRSGVTQVYIRTDMRKKVDEANRKILDFVLGPIAQ